MIENILLLNFYHNSYILTVLNNMHKSTNKTIKVITINVFFHLNF